MIAPANLALIASVCNPFSVAAVVHTGVLKLSSSLSSTTWAQLCVIEACLGKVPYILPGCGSSDAKKEDAVLGVIVIRGRTP